MNDLFSHIEYLLLRHDCIIVPGFGAFIATRSAAKIDQAGGKIAAPTRSVMFNQSVSTDDGLLASSFARKYKISFGEARDLIVRKVAMLIETINANKVITAGRLGILKLGEERNLIFNPLAGDIFSNPLIGFNDINLSQDKITATIPDSHSLPEPLTGDETQTADNNNYYQFRISKTITKIAAVFIFMAVLATTVILNPIPSDKREQKASVVPVEAIINSSKASGNVSTDTVSESDTVKETVKIMNEPLHYLIVATFSGSKEAQAYALSNSTPEYKLFPVKSRKLTRVAVAASNEREVLRKMLNSREIAKRFPNSWIWSRN